MHKVPSAEEISKRLEKAAVPSPSMLPDYMATPGTHSAMAIRQLRADLDALAAVIGTFNLRLTDIERKLNEAMDQIRMLKRPMADKPKADRPAGYRWMR